MNFKELTAEIALRSKVDEQVARRIIKNLFEYANEKMDEGEDVLLPQFAKIVVRKSDSREDRYVLRRRAS